MRRFQLRPFLLTGALVLARLANAQNAERERANALQEALIAKGVMHVPGVEAVGFKLSDSRVGAVDDSYMVVYLNRDKVLDQGRRLQPAEIDMLLAPFLKIASDFGISSRRVGPEFIQRFVALQAKMGTSTSNDAGCFAGTLGIVAKQKTTGVAGYITNAHVAAASARRLCPNGIEREQLAPGRADDPHCMKTTTIGKWVTATHIPVNGKTAAEVDGAFVAEVAGTVDAKNACGLCPTDFSSVNAEVAKNTGMEILTCGRRATPMTTKGTVKDPVAVLWARYACGIRALFKNQIIVEGDFSDRGYSGAVAYGSNAGKATGVLGLIFAADLNSKLTAVNPMDLVLAQLGVDIDTGRACK